jgi:6-phosphofructokinase 1
VFAAHNIRYFFYIGGNDSQDTALKVHEEARRRAYELRVIGIPKTIDNDLPQTDHCPGYGSVVKYNATSVMEIGMDVRSMATDEGSCCIIEVMGRSAGWIAAGTILAKRFPHDGRTSSCCRRSCSTSKRSWPRRKRRWRLTAIASWSWVKACAG